MSKQKIAPLTGFPEWLPAERMVEQHVIDRLRQRFELSGFVPVETRAVEPLDQLLSKGGDTDKEIYVLRRLHAAEGEGDSNLGLHFDLTVPFARYVAQNRGHLTFPIRRYQIQKAWRGERPQEGRYREFYQADADVIAENELSFWYDVEMTMLLHEVTSALPIPPVSIHLNNRKVLEGFYRGLGIDGLTATLRIVDKLDKIGPKAVGEQLVAQVGVSEAVAAQCLALATIRGTDASVAADVRALGVSHPLLDEGLDELVRVMDAAAELPKGRVIADLHIARGLDYYTGIVFEGVMEGHEALGSVCSGGRYENLVGASAGVKLPGIGVSVGVSRILGRLFPRGALRASRPTPTCVLVALISEEERGRSIRVARMLRSRGIAAEIHDRPVKYGKQLRYAEQKGIPFVWFPREDGGDEVRDIRTGAQAPADASLWEPPADDLHVRVERATVTPAE